MTAQVPSDSYNCATCGLALASPNAPCPNCLRDTGNPWPDLKNPLIDLVDKPGLGAAMRHAIERATVARASNENLDPNRKWESDLEDRMGAKPTIVANEIVQLAEGLRDTVMHNAGVMDQYQDWTGVFEDFAKIIAALRGSHETGDGWLPIETAPSDGTEFIVFHKEAGVCACFRTGPESSWYCMDGWNTYVNADGSKRPGLTSFVDPPERWRPMPKPPSKKAKVGGCPTHGLEHFFEGMCIKCGVVPAQGKLEERS